MLAGDVETGKAILRDYIQATVGFEKLGEATHTPARSLICAGLSWLSPGQGPGPGPVLNPWPSPRPGRTGDKRNRCVRTHLGGSRGATAVSISLAGRKDSAPWHPINSPGVK
jgi:hypothetical protein